MGERDKERESAGVCRPCARTLSLHHALSSPISLSLSRKLSLKCQHAATCSPGHTKTASQPTSLQNVPDLRMSHATDFVDLVRTVTVPVPFPFPLPLPFPFPFRHRPAKSSRVPAPCGRQILDKAKVSRTKQRVHCPAQCTCIVMLTMQLPPVSCVGHCTLCLDLCVDFCALRTNDNEMRHEQGTGHVQRQGMQMQEQERGRESPEREPMPWFEWCIACSIVVYSMLNRHLYMSHRSTDTLKCDILIIFSLREPLALA